MEKIKNLFKNKKALYILGFIVLAFLGWYIWETSKRSKRRLNWINWMTAQPDTDPWKQKITAKATAAGTTIAEAISAEAYYLTPANPFKPLL